MFMFWENERERERERASQGRAEREGVDRGSEASSTLTAASLMQGSNSQLWDHGLSHWAIQVPPWQLGKEKRISHIKNSKIGAATVENSMEFPQKIKSRSAWMAQLSFRLQLRSWSHGLWVCPMSGFVLTVQSLEPVSESVSLSLSLPLSCLHTHSLSKINIKKIKNKVTILFINSTTGYLSKENGNTNSKRYIHPYVYCSIFYNSQDMDTTQVSINKWMYKEDFIFYIK